MPSNKFTITVEIIDWWIEDSIDRGYKPIKLFILMKINESLKLMEREYIEN
jgi:hypothetical protein